MTTFEINNVIPYLGSDGRMISIAFVLVALDMENDLREDASWNTPCSMPERAGAAAGEEQAVEYTEAEYKAKCAEIAQEVGLYADLEARLEHRRNRPAPEELPPPAELTGDQKRAIWVAQVDDAIAAILTKYTRFQMGYIEREAAAKAYKESGYTIAPTTWITRFADAINIPYPDAADRILAQAAALRPAVQMLEDLRMDKYLILRAPTLEAADAVSVRIISDANKIAAKL